jgi:hypothetical protein
MSLVMRGEIDNTSDFLKVDEAAQLVGLSHWTVRSWLNKGLLTRYKSASRTVVSRSELLDRVRPLPVVAVTAARSLLLSREV